MVTMFTAFRHASYQVSNLDDSIYSYNETFGSVETGRGRVPELGEVELNADLDRLNFLTVLLYLTNKALWAPHKHKDHDA